MEIIKHRSNDYRRRFISSYGINQMKKFLDSRKYFITPNNTVRHAYIGEQHEDLANRIIDENPQLRAIWEKVQSIYGNPNDSVTFLEFYGYVFAYYDPPKNISYVYSKRSTNGQANDINPDLQPFRDHTREIFELLDDSEKNIVSEIIDAILRERDSRKIMER